MAAASAYEDRCLQLVDACKQELKIELPLDIAQLCYSFAPFGWKRVSAYMFSNREPCMAYIIDPKNPSVLRAFHREEDPKAKDRYAANIDAESDAIVRSITIRVDCLPPEKESDEEADEGREQTIEDKSTLIPTRCDINVSLEFRQHCPRGQLYSVPISVKPGRTFTIIFRKDPRTRNEFSRTQNGDYVQVLTGRAPNFCTKRLDPSFGVCPTARVSAHKQNVVMTIVNYKESSILPLIEQYSGENVLMNKILKSQDMVTPAPDEAQKCCVL